MSDDHRTTSAAEVEAPQSPNGPHRTWRRFTGFVPAALVCLAAARVIHRADVPVTHVLSYAATFGWQVLLPGVVLHRAFLGRGRSLLGELGYGGAIGLLFQLIGWALFVGTGLGRWIDLWPLVVLGPAAVVKRWRGLLDVSPYETRMSPAGAWSLAAAFLYVIRWFGGLPALTTLPNAANQWFQDQYFHLGLAGMFLHQVTPQWPQVAGTPLHYHWFVHAHLAGMSLGSGVGLPEVLTRLYLLPLIAVLAFLYVAVLQDLTRSRWPGVVAFVLTVTAAGVRPQAFMLPSGLGAFQLDSPTQNYSLLILALVIGLIIRGLRGMLSRAGWVLLVVAALASPGAKSSTLPILFAGVCLALAAALFTADAGPLLRRLRPAAVAASVVVAALAVTTPLLGGGASGSGVQLFAVIRRRSEWSRFTHLSQQTQMFSHELVIPGLTTSGAPVFLAIILLSYVVAFAWLLPAVSVLFRRSPEAQAAWFLAGVGLGGCAALMLIDHPGLSQVYFMAQGVIAWHMLAAWGVWQVVTTAQRRVSLARLWWVVPAGAVMGWGYLKLVRHYAPHPRTVADYPGDLLLPLAAVIAAVVAGAGILWFFNRRGRGAGPLTALCLTTAILGAAMPLALPKVPTGLAPNDRTVTAAETTAARWLRTNSLARSVVATNVHCLYRDQESGCDARAFWVSGFSERPVLIEGWAYTDDPMRRNGENGLRFTRVPFGDPSLFALNESAFYHPSADVMQKLAGRGVKWLFADSHRVAQPLSQDIGRYATQVYRNADVTIYRIDQKPST